MKKFRGILYGGDYNPNQWPKEIWKEDMRIFKNAHINSATINVFSWAKLQPSEDLYDFSQLDEIIAMLSEENYEIVLATSTGALPAWMVAKYPEVARTDYEVWTAAQCMSKFACISKIFRRSCWKTSTALWRQSSCEMLAH